MTDPSDIDDIEEVEAELARQRDILEQAEHDLDQEANGVLAPEAEWGERVKAHTAHERIEQLEYRLRELRRGC